MSPHVEELVETGGVYGHSVVKPRFEKVAETGHKTGDLTSKSAVKAHQLLAGDPEKFVEVKDDQGEVCSTLSR